MQLDDGLALAIGTGLAGAVAALWVQVRAQIRDLRKQVGSAIDRIRGLEDQRAALLGAHARDYRELADRSARAIEASTQLLRELLRSLRGRPCLADCGRGDLPPGDDTTRIHNRIAS